MNKTIAVVGGIIILVIIGGLFALASKNMNPPITATSTGTNTNTNTNVNTNQNTKPKVGVPTVSTKSNVSPTDTTAIVSGAVNPNGAFTSYWYEYGTNSNFGSKTGNQTVGSGFVSIASPGYIVGLVKDTTYYFRLVAENQYGKVLGTQFNFTTTHGNPPPTGNAPTTKTVSASGVSRTTANLNGEVTPNQVATQFWFEYGKTTDLGNTSAFSSVGSGTTKVPVSISLSDLDPLTTYYFRLNAQNQFGTINGSILNFKTTGPSSPSAPTATTDNATAITDSTVKLHGKVNPNGAETKYWFEYSTDSLLGSVLLSTTDELSAGAGQNSVSVSADLSDLDSNTTYYFRMVAENSKGTVRGSKLTFKTKN